jgi:hypothetical protein
MSDALMLVMTLLGFQAQDAVAGTASRMLYTHVRSTNEYTIGLVREGYERSAAFRALVDALERSNVVVLVQPGLCAGGRIRSCVVSVVGSERDRHIRVKVDPQHTVSNGLIATIAHELQHAVEIAEHPDVTDGSKTLRLYRSLAFGRCRDGLSEECETTRALDTERVVLVELLKPRKPQTTELQRTTPRSESSDRSAAVTPSAARISPVSAPSSGAGRTWRPAPM